MKNKRITVWVVEDNDAMRTTYAELINSTSTMRCIENFDAAEEAIEALSSQEHPDVIVMDIELPGINGIEAVRRIKEKAPGINVIMQTVYEDNEKIFQSICAGATGYMLKRTPAEKMIESIYEAHTGGAPINAQIARKVLTMFAQEMRPSGADYNLTTREKEILQNLVSGLTIKMIADKLSISAMTVGTHVKKIYAKLQVSSRGEVVAKAIQEKLV